MGDDQTDSAEEVVPRIDIQSRIAAFSQGQKSPPQKPSAKPALLSSGGAAAAVTSRPDSVKRMDQALRKAPSTSTLMRGRQDMIASTTAALGGAPTLPARARSNTSGGKVDNEGETTPESGRESPKLDVKRIIALYGQKGTSGRQRSTTAGESEDREPYVQHEIPPSVPKRPSVSSTHSKEAPPTPPLRSNAAPLLPPRMSRAAGTSGGLTHNDTGSSADSTQSNGNPVAAGALSYVPRKATAQPITSGSPSLPARPFAARSTDDLGLPSRSRNSSSNVALQSRPIGMGPQWASTSSGHLNVKKVDVSNAPDGRTATPPPPPPRHRPSSSIGSAEVNGVSSLIPPKRGTFTVSPTTSRPASPRPTPRTPTTTQRSATSIAPRIGPTSAASGGTESLVPPPRHIDARRATTSGGRGVPTPLEIGGQVRRHRTRRTRRRDERAQMTFERDPSSAVVAQRYGNVFEKYAQEVDSGGDVLIERQTVIRLWRRSKLDARYLQQVWQTALIRSSMGNVTQGLRRDAFIRAMCAIDEELSRRTRRPAGTAV